MVSRANEVFCPAGLGQTGELLFPYCICFYTRFRLGDYRLILT